ncbi:3-hydroxyacyl-ACP dehydratase FabZ family protein [Streptomyces sp. INA 01156]
MSGQVEIRGRLPHRYPMLLVDRVTHVDPGRALTALKAVTCNEPWYAGLGRTPPRRVSVTRSRCSWSPGASPRASSPRGTTPTPTCWPGRSCSSAA